VTKSSNRTLRLHRLTSNSSSATAFRGYLLPTTDYSELVSELLYDWRFTANQFVLTWSPLRVTTSNTIVQLKTWIFSPYVPFSLTRGWVCRLQLLLVFASVVILMYEPHGSHDHILLSQILGSPTWRTRSPYWYPQEQSGPVIPKALCSVFVVSYDSQGYGGDIRLNLHTGCRWIYQVPVPFCKSGRTVSHIKPRHGPHTTENTTALLS
jgi:hypothetical protein